MSKSDVMPVAPKVEFTEAERKKAIQSACYYFFQEKGNEFYASLVQCLTTRYGREVPTAAITYSDKSDSYMIILNPDFFCPLTLDERIGVLHHEILHFTNKHLFRLPFMNASPEDRKLYNVAGDIAINQYIKVLPEGCLDYKKFKDKDGKPFPEKKSMEEYYLLLKDSQEQNKEMLKGSGGPGTPGGTLDDHGLWEQLPEDVKEKMLKEAKKLCTRAKEKASYSHTTVPDSIKDLLDEIDALAAKLDYKRILRHAIKRTVSSTDRTATWNRPNKRYNVYAPGTKNGNLPLLSFYIDTSGSISHKELNEFLSIMENFLKVGVRRCKIALWHTSLYLKKPHKFRQRFRSDELSSGGTDITCAMEDIVESRPDLSIVLTDGYYDESKIKPNSEVIFIISKGGNKDHPMKGVGKTILLENLL